MHTHQEIPQQQECRGRSALTVSVLQAGTPQTVFDKLPGFPDGISRASDGKSFWLSIVNPPNLLSALLKYRHDLEALVCAALRMGWMGALCRGCLRAATVVQHCSLRWRLTRPCGPAGGPGGPSPGPPNRCRRCPTGAASSGCALPPPASRCHTQGAGASCTSARAITGAQGVRLRRSRGVARSWRA